MIFKREHIYSIIERQVKHSLEDDNPEGRITEVVLTPKEWSVFCKQHKGHSGQYSNRSIKIRFMLPLNQEQISMGSLGDDIGDQYISYHEVNVVCNASRDPHGF
jgi:hypothetical protein